MRLTAQDVTVRAGDRVLLHLDRLELPRGSLTGVMGPSGAGKTTLLNALSGLTAAQGALRWDDTDLARMGQAARVRFRRDHIGLIFQDFLLLEELTALENATIARAWRGDAQALTQRAAALFDRLGIAALTHRRAERLSGGERQRVAVARALAHDPAILLADEPTASLDRTTADRLIGDLAALARDEGRTVLIVSHDPAVHAAMDRMLTIRDGVLI
ncbi:ABC transporter ATP-binding protein [Paracoccus sp. (in: a-proteobacteria)]|uniref:ABC transporter ATP-binding protein n=1 Tax=Paracoccus sp. TaxID=267 RepID=UPI0026E0BBDC|nr:ATP-binding cassette domain-containing protein [Paracoccus sp. (in: a-proteobacteria)]MDO5646613.1 ATP-binding cassette domain-containing protein [Paracoccus sp. (in: a-proteobacteria)]